MISIPATRLKDFQTNFWPTLKGKQRLGQAFYGYMHLQKVNCTESANWIASLYEMPDAEAAKAILENLDWNN